MKRLSLLFVSLGLFVFSGLAQSTALDDWKLVAYNFARVNNYPVEDKDVTMTLDTVQQRISGNSGCNRFVGGFRFEDSGRLAVGPFAGTLMSCPRIENRFESEFRETLGKPIRSFLRRATLLLPINERDISCDFSVWSNPSDTHGM